MNATFVIFASIFPNSTIAYGFLKNIESKLKKH